MAESDDRTNRATGSPALFYREPDSRPWWHRAGKVAALLALVFGLAVAWEWAHGSDGRMVALFFACFVLALLAGVGSDGRR